MGERGAGAAKQAAYPPPSPGEHCRGRAGRRRGTRQGGRGRGGACLRL